VFAINPGSQFAAFQAAAIASGTSSAAAASTAAPAASGVVTVTATVTGTGGTPVTTTYGSYPGSASPTSGVSTDHQVVVGGTSAGLVYTPSNITAQPGDTVTFQFQQKNHTVTQSTFANPCRALTLTSTTGQVGFDSGFMPVGANATSFPTYTIQVNDTTPIWAYCKQTAHCGQGMVFAINAVETSANTFEAFKAQAIALNGTASATSSGATPYATTQTGTPNVSGALPQFAHGASIAISVSVAAIAVGISTLF